MLAQATPTYQQPQTNVQPSSFMSPTAPIGGTSGGVAGQGGGSNVLSMNLGGVNVNFDMGASSSDMATQAYNFLGNSFNADSALLGQTIVGSQNFVAGFAAPVLSMAETQQNFNTQVLPSMFGTLSAQNYSLGSQAIGAESSVAQASVAASSAASAQATSSSGGGCFITTAVCESRGEADDCPTLTKLRAFRDSFMQETKARQDLVRLYYDCAPKIVERINAREDVLAFNEYLYARFIVPACASIDRGNLPDAFNLYVAMLVFAQQEA
jgi:hypothetical protein